MERQFIVRLTDAERLQLREVVAKLQGASQQVKRAWLLLQADVDGPGWTDRRIAEAFDCRAQTVESLRQRLVERGFAEALDRAPRMKSPTPKLLDGQQEAQVIVLRLGPPPQGCASWSMRLLARKVVELEIVESIRRETVRRTLKKTA